MKTPREEMIGALSKYQQEYCLKCHTEVDNGVRAYSRCDYKQTLECGFRRAYMPKA